MTPIRPSTPAPLSAQTPAGSVASARAAFFSAMGAADTAPVAATLAVAQTRNAVTAPAQIQIQPLSEDAPARPLRPGSLLDIRV